MAKDKIDNTLDQYQKNNTQNYDLRIPMSTIRSNQMIDSKGQKVKINDINTDYTTYNFPLQQNEIALYYKKTFPIIRVYELQPNVLYSFIQKIARTIKDAKGLYVESKQMVKNALEIISKADKLMFSDTQSADGMADFIDKILANIAPQQGERTDLYKLSLDTFYSSLPGYYLNSYELPYSGTSAFSVKSGAGWVDGSGRYFDQIFKTVEDFLGIDTIAYPEFKMSSAMTERMQFVTKFNLINNNIDNLIKNIRFIHMLYPGAIWGRLGLRAVPSMIYTLDIPGVNFCRYSTMDLDIKGKGFQKKLPSDILSKVLTNLGLTNSTDGQKKSGYINEETFFPEIYSVDMTFKSILPYTFEMYADYLLNGRRSDVDNNSLVNILTLDDKNETK